MSQQYGWTPPPPSYGRVAVPPPASTLAPARPTLGSSVVFIGAWLVLLWMLEALDAVATPTAIHTTFRVRTR